MRKSDAFVAKIVNTRLTKIFMFTRKNDAFVAKIVNMRLTKIFMVFFLPPTKGCQVLPPCLVDNSTYSKPYQSKMQLSAGARMIQSWLDARNYWHRLPSLSLKATGIRATTRATDTGTGVKAQLHVHQLSTIGHT